jgi:hypothetical protein
MTVNGWEKKSPETEAVQQISVIAIAIAVRTHHLVETLHATSLQQFVCPNRCVYCYTLT